MTLQTLKTILLALTIGVGSLMHAGTAQARDLQTAVFAGGCFWCIEADFERVGGVIDVVSGYTGGTTASPSYATLKGSGHYEAVQITYDADQVSYDQLLHLFFRSVDPTDAGGQFCDRGDSYRTAVFVANSAERQAALSALSQAQAQIGRSIVTPVLNAARFYDAEEYHQDYYKSSQIVLTRRGPKSKAEAYKFYRNACGRDARVREIWGDAAAFAKG